MTLALFATAKPLFIFGSVNKSARFFFRTPTISNNLIVSIIQTCNIDVTVCNARSQFRPLDFLVL